MNKYYDELIEDIEETKDYGKNQGFCLIGKAQAYYLLDLMSLKEYGEIEKKIVDEFNLDIDEILKISA